MRESTGSDKGLEDSSSSWSEVKDSLPSEWSNSSLESCGVGEALLDSELLSSSDGEGTLRFVAFTLGLSRRARSLSSDYVNLGIPVDN